MEIAWVNIKSTPSKFLYITKKLYFNFTLLIDPNIYPKTKYDFNVNMFIDSIEKKQYKLFEFEVKNNALSSNVIDGSYEGNMKLGKITIMGISEFIRQVFINDKEVEYEYDKEKMVSPYYTMKLRIN